MIKDHNPGPVLLVEITVLACRGYNVAVAKEIWRAINQSVLKKEGGRLLRAH